MQIRLKTLVLIQFSRKKHPGTFIHNILARRYLLLRNNLSPAAQCSPHFSQSDTKTPRKTEKSPSPIQDRLVSGHVQLQRAGNLAAAEAAGADVDVLGGTVNNRLYALHIGLPCAVGTSVGVADLNPEGNALIAELALCHAEAPPWMVFAENTALL